MKRKQPRYIYYADFACGSLIDATLAGLIDQIKNKFAYLRTIPENLTAKRGLTDDDMIEWNSMTSVMDAGYHRRNTFGRGFSGWRGYLLNSYAFVELEYYDYWFSISRMQK
jgi:hypothetical protein